MQKKDISALPKRSRLRKSILNRSSGFSLVEVLIGLVMFSTIILAVFQVFLFSTVQNIRTNEMDELYSIAQKSMEYVKNNVVVRENANYSELYGYADDINSEKKFVVIYKAEMLNIKNPLGEPDISGLIPTKVYNYNVFMEVFYSRDRERLGAIGEFSKKDLAKNLNIPIFTLNSQLTQYED